MTSVTETLPRVLQTEEIRYLWCIASAVSPLHRFKRYSALLRSYERHGVELREPALSVVVSTHVSDRRIFSSSLSPSTFMPTFCNRHLQPICLYQSAITTTPTSTKKVEINGHSETRTCMSRITTARWRTVANSVLRDPHAQFSDFMPGDAKAIVCGRLTIRPYVLDNS